MKVTNKPKGIMKKAIALTLGITVAFGALSLPAGVYKGGFETASAATIVIDGCKYTYAINNDRGVNKVVLKGVEGHGETVTIPSSIKYAGEDCPVYTISTDFLKGDQTVKTIIFSDSVKEIELSVLSGSSVENIVLPDGLEKLDNGFASSCPNLKSVKYNGTKIYGNNMGANIFSDSNTEALYNEKGALCLGNWLLKYKPDSSVTELKPSELKTEGVKIDSIANYALCNNNYITTVDLEGIKCLSSGSFDNYFKLESVINDDDVEFVHPYVFIETPWRERAMEGDLIKLGKALIYYKTDSPIIDLTSGELKGTKCICKNALSDCVNANTFMCDSDCTITQKCFHVAHEQTGPGENTGDPLPRISTYNIKEVYIDGKKLTYKLVLEDPDVYKWFITNYSYIEGSEFIRTMVEEKTKALFKQLDLTYYGLDNREYGNYTPTEEFYIRLKIHNYISLYEYNLYDDYQGFAEAFLRAGKVGCNGYADLTHHLLECAGVEDQIMAWNGTIETPPRNAEHYWNSTRIGDEWFESDDGADAQNNNHVTRSYLISSQRYTQIGGHYMYALESYHSHDVKDGFDRNEAKRTLGDMDHDEDRDTDDLELLLAYIKLPDSIDHSMVNIDKKAADINFDGNIDITDAVLMENWINGKALDMENIPVDGLAPTVRIAFLNGEDYNDIKYLYTDREGYITLPDDIFEAPEGKKISYDVGKAGEKVRITNPMTVVNVKWIDENEPDSSQESSSNSESSKNDSSNDSSKPDDDRFKLGDVNGEGAIDIEDAVAIISNINGLTPLTDDQEKRADVSKDGNIDIDDAVLLISYINGNSTF